MMAATLRSYVKRRFEDRLVGAIECLDCGAPRGRRCVDRDGRERVTCCGARADLGSDILLAETRMWMLLVECGLVEDGGWGS